jgi:hypothetical protein
MGSPANVFVKALTEFVLTDEAELPTAIALEAINREAKKALFTP